MKILLQGGNYKNSFNPQIYFGHIVEKGIPGHEVVTFGLHERDQIRWRPEEPFDAVLSRLPAGWRPDVYLCQGAEYHLFPEGLERAPFPLVATVFDYDYHVTSAMRYARLFDLIVAYGEEAKEDFQKMGCPRVVSVPDWSGFLPEMFPGPPRPFEGRAFDITFAGQIDDVHHPDRSGLLLRLAELPESVRVRIQTYLTPREYGRILSDSRLVFTYHRRGEIQSRLLDAMANGAVGFCPEAGEIGRYFQDQTARDPEYLSFSEDRIEAVVGRWLDDPRVGIRMSRSGRRKAMAAYDSRTALKRLFDAVAAELPDLRAPRDRPPDGGWEVFYPIKSLYSDDAQQHWLRHLERSRVRLEEKVAASPSPLDLNELAVCLIGLANGDRNRSGGIRRINRAVQVLKDCLERYPRYAMAAFNLGWVYVLIREDAAAESTFRYAALLLESGEGLLDPAANYDIEHNALPHSFRRPYYDDMLDYIRTRRPEPLERMKRLIASTCWYLAGMAARRLGKSDRVGDALHKAVRADGRRGAVLFALARELRRQGRLSEAAAACSRALELLPFDPKVVRDTAAYRYESGDVSGTRQILDRWRRVAGRVDLLSGYKEYFEESHRRPERLLSRPPVSVVIPLYNYGRFIVPCIASVLNQTYERIEIIVVDHGSTDDGPERVRAFGDRVRLLQCPRDGSAHNTTAPLNMGIREAQGEFIAWLNADDLFHPEKIERQIDAVVMDDSVDLVYSDYLCEILAGVSPENLKYLQIHFRKEDWQALSHNGYLRGLGRCPRSERHEILYKMMEGNFIIASTTLIRKSVFDRHGYFEETLPQAQDYAMWMSIMASSARVVHLPEALATFRIHETNTRSWEGMMGEVNRVRRRALQWPIVAFDPRLKARGSAQSRAAAHFRLVQPLLSGGLLVEALDQVGRAVRLDPNHTGYAQELRRLDAALQACIQGGTPAISIYRDSPAPRWAVGGRSSPVGAPRSVLGKGSS